MRKLQHHQKGFTLVELIITLLIGSILLAWGVPSYRDFKVRKQVSDTANEIVYSINLARAEAIRYGSDVKMERNGGNWKNGWSVFTLDEVGNNDTLIHEQEALASNLKITQSGDFTGDLVFNNIGAMINGLGTQFALENDPTVNGSADVSDDQRNIVVSPSGSARAVKP